MKTYHRKYIFIISVLIILCIFFSGCSGDIKISEETISGESTMTDSTDKFVYDHTKDSFYEKSQYYLTWIMIWNGSTETHWWRPEDYLGTKIKVNNKWQAINWNNAEHIHYLFGEMKDAGIDVIIADLTNGLRWHWQSLLIQKLCYENDMKFAVAFNPQSGREMESQSQKVWESYARPEALYSDAYYYKDGKPLLVLYTTRSGFDNSIKSSSEYGLKFTNVWASGEDSDINKWGWQLEPHIGVLPDQEAMFITSSIKFDSPNGTTEETWRKSLAWIDYGFHMAEKYNPEYVIVGSFDDTDERNGWMRVDTEEALPGWQMRDISGRISIDAYYERIKSWIQNGFPPVVSGGIITDGGYMIGTDDNRILSIEDIKSSRSPAFTKEISGDIGDYFWFYHLGNNEYRIIKLNSGFSLEASSAAVFQNWDNEYNNQIWIAADKGNNKYSFYNKENGQFLSWDVKSSKANLSDIEDEIQTIWEVKPKIY